MCALITNIWYIHKNTRSNFPSIFKHSTINLYNTLKDLTTALYLQRSSQIWSVINMHTHSSTGPPLLLFHFISLTTLHSKSRARIRRIMFYPKCIPTFLQCIQRLYGRTVDTLRKKTYIPPTHSYTLDCMS